LQWAQALVDAFVVAVAAESPDDLHHAASQLMAFFDRFEVLDGEFGALLRTEAAVWDACLDPTRRLAHDAFIADQFELLQEYIFDSVTRSGLVAAASIEQLRRELGRELAALSEQQLYVESPADVVERTRPRRSIQAMTINGAKGLEFDAVAVVGLNMRALPHHQSNTRAKQEEDLRKLYVAVTRARFWLLLQFDRSRASGFLSILKGELTADRYMADLFGTAPL
jgi:superfamily I DNA/RNA helicase